MIRRSKDQDTSLSTRAGQLHLRYRVYKGTACLGEHIVI